METKVAVGRYSLPRCNYGTYITGHPPGAGETDCGKPAVAKWQWEEGVTYACEEHDKVISDRKDKDWKTGLE